MTLKAGKSYLFCTCGRSSDQPFCDGSHGESGFEPLSFSPEDEGEMLLCRCKQTGDPPRCDGSHSKIADEQVGQPLPSPAPSPAPEAEQEAEPEAEPEAEAMPEPQSTATEPHVELIHELAEHGLEQVGAHGPVAAMGVPRSELPSWDRIQILTAQLDRTPLAEDHPVATDLVLGAEAARPLWLRCRRSSRSPRRICLSSRPVASATARSC